MMDQSPPKSLTPEEDALLEKYKQERAKRIRTEGIAQFVKTEGKFAHFLHDPYVKDPLVRGAIAEDADVVIVGGGFSGMLMGARLRQAGVDNIRIVETGADFGGVWYWNRYPGCAVDLDSYIYMPMLEEIGYMPTEKYAKAGEIRQYAQAIGRHFDLYRNALFQTQVTRVFWDEAASRWIVTTNRGDELKARFVVIGSGPLNHPKLPGVRGIETFKGHSFHTSRWDYDYTGGDPSGNLTGLKDKRVALIGTGATGIQCVAPIGEWAKQLYVVQRTPAVVGIRGNKPLDSDWASRLDTGWQRRRQKNFDGLLAGLIDGEDLVADEWTDFWAPPKLPQTGTTPESVRALVQKLDIEKMDNIRARIESIVNDPVTANALKPYYNRFCKRPTFNDEYLPTFNRLNVKLIDTQGRGLDRITENAIVFDGKSYEVDCIIYATGFEMLKMSHKTGGFEVIGRGGQTLDEKWEKAVTTLHGIYTWGFPNLFVVAGLRQSAITVNFSYIADEQASHTARFIKRLIDENVKVAEVTKDAEDRWCATIIEKSKIDLDYIRACTPSYFNNEGDLEGLAKLAFTTAYGGGIFEYSEILKKWRESGFYEDMALKRSELEYAR
jgi:cyclohexanone monooxygenase